MQVSTQRLDTLFQDVSRLQLLKFDVEGSEVEVLEGARTLIERCRPRLIFELSPSYLRETGQSPERLLSLLEGYDFFVLADERRGPFSREELLAEADTQQINVLAIAQA